MSTLSDLMTENRNMKNLLLRMLPDIESRCKGLQNAFIDKTNEHLVRNEGFITDIKQFTEDFEDDE